MVKTYVFLMFSIYGSKAKMAEVSPEQSDRWLGYDQKSKALPVVDLWFRFLEYIGSLYDKFYHSLSELNIDLKFSKLANNLKIA